MFSFWNSWNICMYCAFPSYMLTTPSFWFHILWMCFFIAFWTLSLITLCCFGLLLYFHPAFCFWFTAMLTHVCLKYWFKCFLVYLYFLGSLFFLLLLLLSYAWLLQPELSEFPVLWLIEYPNILQTFSLNLCLAQI